MIKINFETQTYVCPFCGHAQAYANSYDIVQNGFFKNRSPIPEEHQESSYSIYTLRCNNSACKKIAVSAINRTDHKQIDIVPQVVIRHFPDFIPEQIIKDYEEANLILERSPKAAATLLRRCLQGMIRDFWNIHGKNLNAEVTALKDKIPVTQWKAIDSLRTMGNIGAHMEQDVNVIVDIESEEARKLMSLIELLLEKWYVSRHDEEELFNGITEISLEKEAKRKEQ